MNILIKKGIELALKVEPLDDKILENERLDTCKKCENYDINNDKCGVCGCYMEIKVGLKYNRNPKKGGRIEITHCPMGKWNDIETANVYRKIDGLSSLG